MYCSIEEVRNKDTLNLTTAMTDSEIENYIQVSMDMIDHLTKSIFDVRYLKFTYDDLNIYDYSIFTPYPVISLDYVKDYDTEIEVKYTKGKRKITSIISYVDKYKFSKYTTVEGYFGYEETPFEIKEATCILALWIIEYKDDLSPNILRESIDTITVQYGSKLPNQVLNLLFSKTRTRMKLI
jgi:hypothetical protein